MKITFLGTGAADWNYDIHKDIEEYRRNSSILIDDCFLVDPGSNVINALDKFDKNIENIKYIICSHKHFDHYNENTVSLLKNGELISLNSGETKNIGKYIVSAYKANHSTCENAVHFIISDGEKKIFYGLDGAWLLYDEVEAIKKNTVDIAILDATIGGIVGDYRIFEHNNLNMVIEIKSSLEHYVKKWVISHMARTLHTSHEKLVNRMSKYNIDVAFDGLEIKI